MTGETSLSSDDMARMRTLMAADRTLMAWVRTALSMISFGFTIFKFFQYLYESASKPQVPQGARNLALILTGLAVASLVVGVLEHHRVAASLGARVTGNVWRSMPVLTALVLAVIGSLVFVSVWWRSGPF